MKKSEIQTEPSGGQEVFGVLLIGFNVLAILINGLEVPDDWLNINDVLFMLGQLLFMIIGMSLILNYRSKLKKYNLYLKNKDKVVKNDVDKIQSNKHNYLKIKKNLYLKLVSIICIISISSNIYLGIQNYEMKNEINEKTTQLVEANKNKEHYEKLYNIHNEATEFLNTYVAIIPSNENVYLNYRVWNNSKFENEAFYIMSMNEAKSRGYSNKYMQSPIPYEIYNELYN